MPPKRCLSLPSPRSRAWCQAQADGKRKQQEGGESAAAAAAAAGGGGGGGGGWGGAGQQQEAQEPKKKTKRQPLIFELLNRHRHREQESHQAQEKRHQPRAEEQEEKKEEGDGEKLRASPPVLHRKRKAGDSEEESPFDDDEEEDDDGVGGTTTKKTAREGENNEEEEGMPAAAAAQGKPARQRMRQESQDSSLDLMSGSDGDGEDDDDTHSRCRGSGGEELAGRSISPARARALAPPRQHMQTRGIMTPPRSPSSPSPQQFLHHVQKVKEQMRDEEEVDIGKPLSSAPSSPGREEQTLSMNQLATISPGQRRRLTMVESSGAAASPRRSGLSPTKPTTPLPARIIRCVMQWRALCKDENWLSHNASCVCVAPQIR